MTKFQQLRERDLDDPLNLNRSTINDFGLPASTVELHANVVYDLKRGGVSKQNLAKLHAVAKQSGVPASYVNAELKKILRLPAEQRPAAYVRSTSPGAQIETQSFDRAVDLLNRYERVMDTARLESRLERNAKNMLVDAWKPGPDERAKQAAADQASMRSTIEQALKASVGAHDAPQTIDDLQHRARLRSERAAQLIESNARRESRGESISLRDRVEEAYEAESAFAARHDAGIDPTPQSGATVLERSQAQDIGERWSIEHD